MSATGARAAAAARLAQALRERVLAGPARSRGRSSARPSLGRPRPRTLLAAATALVLLIAGWFWLRDSSLVAVRTVEVTGIAGTQGARVRDALEEAARSMTTLHVRRGALDTAAAPFSIVKRIEVSTSFPHTMRIHVVTNVAVGAVVVDGKRIAVTSDGTLLRDAPAPVTLPEIPVRSTPAGARLTERAAVAAVEALGAAPSALRTRVEAVQTTGDRGLTLQLAHGPLLVFGDAARFGAKWAAAAAVLADPQSAGASAIDVSAPERPAVSGLPDGAPATGESDLPTLPQGTTDPTVTTPAPTTTTSP
ncbi:MAG: cell division protein FtsQ/DivIB [Actinobacteria bacterium]|nr:cell division protein FtsQ/DivIB [Actinomycetota bacterium]